MTAKKLIAQLAVIDENILMEAANMATMFSHAARYRVDAMRNRTRAEAALEECDATLSLRYRARQSGERKTEAYFKARIALNSRHRKLQSEKEEAEYREELAKLLIDAYKMRRDAIRIIADHLPLEGMREEQILERRDQQRRLSKHARHLESRRRRAERNE
jgi:hypothetical protein